MAGHEQVVVALGRVGVAHQAALGADRVELRGAAGDQLVRIDLVAGVPDQPVLGEVEDEVQRQAELDDAEVGGEVGGAQLEHRPQFDANFLGQSLELGQAHLRSSRGDRKFAKSGSMTPYFRRFGVRRMDLAHRRGKVQWQGSGFGGRGSGKTTPRGRVMTQEFRV